MLIQLMNADKSIIQSSIPKGFPGGNKFKVQSCRGGFTLIELLVVTVILGVLAAIGLITFQTSQMKSRDAKRKSDLEQVQRALEMYVNDYGNYPTSAGGKIVVGSALDWGTSEFKDSKETIYMKQLPKDPTGNPEYCYVYEAGPPVAYKIYAKLENSQDPRCLGGNCATARACGTDTYNYGVASSNVTP